MTILRQRGMRNVRTVQTLIHQRADANRVQVVGRLAQLENEHARLTRERQNWSSRQEEVEHKLSKVQQEIETLQHVLWEPAARGKRRSSSRSVKNAPNSSNKKSAQNSRYTNMMHNGTKKYTNNTALAPEKAFLIEY
ncbi:MAG: hypothetical protein FD149_244 [Rhodospirillaceae bacterium]|nr:MAG: hypothetical protein FD149_244 [Rhodospirillaceae bacterium]